MFINISKVMPGWSQVPNLKCYTLLPVLSIHAALDVVIPAYDLDHPATVNANPISNQTASSSLLSENIPTVQRLTHPTIQ